MEGARGLKREILLLAWHLLPHPYIVMRSENADSEHGKVMQIFAPLISVVTRLFPVGQGQPCVRLCVIYEGGEFELLRTKDKIFYSIMILKHRWTNRKQHGRRASQYSKFATTHSATSQHQILAIARLTPTPQKS
ncbi:hypothetical protein LOAG_06224, partial [Loa loa]